MLKHEKDWKMKKMQMGCIFLLFIYLFMYSFIYVFIYLCIHLFIHFVQVSQVISKNI